MSDPIFEKALDHMMKVEEQEDIYVPKVGDTVQIMDLEGNTTPVPKATVYDVSEDTEGNIAVEITGSDDEDELLWYGENEYQIILLTSAKESKEEVEEGKVPDDKDSEEVKIKKLTEAENPEEFAKKLLTDTSMNPVEVQRKVQYKYGFDPEDSEKIVSRALDALGESKVNEQDDPEPEKKEKPEEKPAEDEKDKD